MTREDDRIRSTRNVNRTTEISADWSTINDIYEAVIPRNVRVSEAPSFGKPVLIYDLKCSGSQAYLKLAKEVVGRERRRLAA